MGAKIVEAFAAFENDRAELLRDHRGQWVGYWGSRRLGIDESVPQLYETARRHHAPQEEFLVRHIDEGADDDVLECRFATFDGELV